MYHCLYAHRQILRSILDIIQAQSLVEQSLDVLFLRYVVHKFIDKRRNLNDSGARSKAWRALPNNVRDHTLLLLDEFAKAWAMRRKEVLEQDDEADFPTMPSPKDDHKLKLVELMKEQNAKTILRVWKIFLHRAEGFGSDQWNGPLKWPVLYFIGKYDHYAKQDISEKEFEHYMDSEPQP